MKKFENPKLEIMNLTVSDVITTSTGCPEEVMGCENDLGL